MCLSDRTIFSLDVNSLAFHFVSHLNRKIQNWSILTIIQLSSHFFNVMYLFSNPLTQNCLFLVVQSYRANMATHRDNFHWQRWSFEDTTELLSRRFPDSFVWLIPASRMHLQKFSCYDNFVTSNLFGAPKHSSNGHAFEHLLALLLHGGRQASQILKEREEVSDIVQERNGGFSPAKNSCDAVATKANDNFHESANLEKLQTDDAEGSCRIGGSLFQLHTQLTLVGFSKGCVVFNQLVYELSTATT